MVKILDFEFAKDLERETSLTSSLNQSILGTPDYVSPEQVMGNRVHQAQISTRSASSCTASSKEISVLIRSLGA